MVKGTVKFGQLKFFKKLWGSWRKYGTRHCWTNSRAHNSFGAWRVGATTEHRSSLISLRKMLAEEEEKFRPEAIGLMEHFGRFQQKMSSVATANFPLDASKSSAHRQTVVYRVIIVKIERGITAVSNRLTELPICQRVPAQKYFIRK